MAAALLPYAIPALLGGFTGAKTSKDKFGGFVKGALAGAGAGYLGTKLGGNPFSSMGGAPTPGGGGGSGFNPMSFFNQDSQRIDPEQELQPIWQQQPQYLPPMTY